MTDREREAIMLLRMVRNIATSVSGRSAIETMDSAIETMDKVRAFVDALPVDLLNQSKAASKPPQDLDERATAVLRDRTAAHGEQNASGQIATEQLHQSFKTLGGVWRCLLQAAWPETDVPLITPWLAATLMAGLKVWRMCKMTGEQFDDSCIDNINYTRIANKLRVWEEEQSAQTNGDSADEAMHPSSTQSL